MISRVLKNISLTLKLEQALDNLIDTQACYLVSSVN